MGYWRTLGLAGAATLAIAAVPWRAHAVPATCESFQGPDCGDAVGDAACGDPLLDCVDTGNGCECEHHACCTCESVTGTSDCDVPCEEQPIDGLQCAQACFEAVGQGATCNLKVAVDQPCGAGGCPTTGCCQFAVNTGTASAEVCVETDETTCGIPAGRFLAGGSCEGGLLGTCVLPNGDACQDPSDCGSGFCADGVCCNAACDQPGQTCSVPGRLGTCLDATPAPAPALSPLALLFGLGILTATGAVALRARRRTMRS